MNRNKILSIVMIAAVLAAFPIGTAYAATGTTPVIGTGTITSITIETDALTKISTVLVALSDGAGGTQEVKISLETAITMGLIIPDAAMVTGTPVVITDPADVTIELVNGTITGLTLVTDPITKISSLTVAWTDALLVPHTTILDLEKAIALGMIITDPTKVNTDVVIDPLNILESTSESASDVKNIALLEQYFGTTLGLTTEQLTGFKDAGFGFGEIAQAAWMAVNLEGDATLMDQILTAKSSGDFSTLTLPEGVTADNWGQLRKALITDKHQNLGQIISGHSESLTPSADAELTGKTHGNGNGHGHGKGPKK